MVNVNKVRYTEILLETIIIGILFSYTAIILTIFT